MPGFYARWMDRWETRLASQDTNRVVRPFEWGLEWLGLDPSEADPAAALDRYPPPGGPGPFDFEMPRDFVLDGTSLTFSSALRSPYPVNNTVHAEYFPASRPGRAVLVIPQWNSGSESHLALCRLLARLGISALRLSKAYHHRRMPAELQRADYHVSANLGRTIHATRQSVIDARAALHWLGGQGHGRRGILGTSLGSCVALLTAAHEPALAAAVFNHVSPYFSDVVLTGLSCRHIQVSLDTQVTPEALRRYWAVISPANYLQHLRGRQLRSLLVWARHDTTFLPELSRRVIEDFRRHGLAHEVAELPCGHYTTGRFPFVLLDAWAMCRFLQRTL